MPIPREFATSNPQVRDALALIPPANGVTVGDFVAPDFPIDAEVVDTVTTATHELNLDDLRAADAEAKMIRFEVGGAGTASIEEHAQKSRLDSRKIEEAGDSGVDLIARRLASHRDDILAIKEYWIANKVYTAGNFGTHTAAGVNFRTADLYATIEAAQTLIHTDGNDTARYGLIGRTAFSALRLNANFITHVVGANQKAGARDLPLAAVAEYFGLEEVRLASFWRTIKGVATQFWADDSFLIFQRNNTLTDRSMAQVAVCPYGQYQNVAEGTLVDARTAPISGTDLLTEIGAYHRYRVLLSNYNLGYLWTGIVKT